MQTDYNDSTHDPEAAWRESSSAAGEQTRQLSSAWASTGREITPVARQRNNLIGMALVALGLFIPLTRIVPDREAFNAGMILLIIASCFLFLAFWRRFYAFLIPGSILTGLSLGVPLAELTNGVSVLWGLALAFVSIYFVGHSLFGIQNRWPLIPAVPLFGVGMIVAVVSLPILLASNMIVLPLLLIGAGLYLGWGQRPA